jgi:hypothetical protein
MDLAFVQGERALTLTFETFRHDDPADAPADFDITGWYTHFGLCPDCRAEDEASE